MIILRKYSALVIIGIMVILFAVPTVFGAFGDPFGGRIITKYLCDCSGNYQVLIGPPMGGSFTMDSATVVYNNNNPDSPNWALGLAEAYAPCLKDVLFGCSPAGPGGPRIRMMGTS